MTITTEKITKTIVSINDRIKFLPKHTGNCFMQFENKIYNLANDYLENYNGGYWEFYELSNGGFYMSIDSAEPVNFYNDGNNFEEQLDSDSACIILNLIALSELSFDYPNSCFAEKFHLLRDFSFDHEKAALIMRAID